MQFLTTIFYAMSSEKERDTIDFKTRSIWQESHVVRLAEFCEIMHFELVQNGCAISAKLYGQQLEWVYKKLKQKYPALINQKHVLMQQDNAKPQTSRKTKDKFEVLDSATVLPHPAYSPDLLHQNTAFSAQSNTF